MVGSTVPPGVELSSFPPVRHVATRGAGRVNAHRRNCRDGRRGEVDERAIKCDDDGRVPARDDRATCPADRLGAGPPVPGWRAVATHHVSERAVDCDRAAGARCADRRAAMA